MIVVNETNSAPTWSTIPDTNIVEGMTLTIPLGIYAHDSDNPTNPLTFMLLSVLSLHDALPISNSGITVDAASGVLTWATVEANGPSTNVVRVMVRDEENTSVVKSRVSAV